MTHENLLELGFCLYGVDEDDPYYKIIFEPPFNFGVQTLSGSLTNNKFHLYGNDTIYTDPNELKSVIKIFGTKIYKPKYFIS